MFPVSLFLCLSMTKVVNLRDDSKMALSLFSRSRLLIGLERCGVTVYSKFPNVAESGLCYIISWSDTVFSLFFSIFANLHFPHMKNTTYNESRKDYQIPSLRFVETNLEMSFLQSNLEPIDGGDDPDIDW